MVPIKNQDSLYHLTLKNDVEAKINWGGIGSFLKSTILGAILVLKHTFCQKTIQPILISILNLNFGSNWT